MKRLLRPLLRRIARALGIIEMQSRLDDVQSHMASEHVALRAVNQSTIQKMGALERHLERRYEQHYLDVHALLKDLRQSMVTTWHLEAVTDAIQKSLMAATTTNTEHSLNEVRRYLEDKVNKAARDLDNIRRMISVEATSFVAERGVSLPSPVLLDEALYVSLEDHFRGDAETIRNQQLEYVPYVDDIVSEQFPLLDLGCGRGEWLKVLAEKKLTAHGVDSNRACVAECHEQGLNVKHGDLLGALSEMPDASCGAITMFQVLEHLPFDAVIEVLRQSLRVLIPGGVFIGEIPNSETLRVGASTFWIDPTHQRPLFPSVLAFLATSVGFAGVIGRYSSPLALEPDLTGVPTSVAETILGLHHAINGPGDFALIATA